MGAPERPRSQFWENTWCGFCSFRLQLPKPWRVAGLLLRLLRTAPSSHPQRKPSASCHHLLVGGPTNELMPGGNLHIYPYQEGWGGGWWWKAICLSGKDTGWLLSLQGIGRSWQKQFQPRAEVPTHHPSSPGPQERSPQTPASEKESSFPAFARKMHTPSCSPWSLWQPLARLLILSQGKSPSPHLSASLSAIV